MRVLKIGDKTFPSALKAYREITPHGPYKATRALTSPPAASAGAIAHSLLAAAYPKEYKLLREMVKAELTGSK